MDGGTWPPPRFCRVHIHRTYANATNRGETGKDWCLRWSSSGIVREPLDCQIDYLTLTGCLWGGMTMEPR